MSILRSAADYVSGASLAADYLSPIITAHEMDRVELSYSIHIYSANSPSGDIYVLGSNSRDALDSANWPNSIPPALYIDANRVHGAIDGALASHTGGFAVAITSATDDSEFTISVVDGVPMFSRIFFDRTAGGASGIDIAYSLVGV